MHKPLALRLLGAPEIRLADQPLTTPVAAKAQALLYYLALTGRAHTRSALAGLLWGDMPEEMARTNLRKALADLRPVANGYLLSDNQMIGLKQEPALWVDVEIFASALQSPERQIRQEALDLYRGDLLEGFYVRNAPDFENWLVSERAHYRQKVVQALHDLAADYAQQGALSEAIGVLRRLLTLEPWDETSQRTLMVWLAQSGQRSAALTQFEACRRALEAELAVEPDEETVALYEQIRAGKLDKVTRWQGDRETGRQGDKETLVANEVAGRSQGDKVDRGQSGRVAELPNPPIDQSPNLPISQSLPHNLPEPTTPLVGRQAELAQLQSLLAEPACRLLTLTGPGGMGKTRLALAAARTCVAPSGGPETGNVQAMPLATCHAHFEDGVYFVALAAIRSPVYIVPTIADALGLRFAGTLDVQTQLINYLRQKKLLLVLDNLEQLMSEAATEGMAAPAEASATLLLELLQRAPALKLLATSREPLNLAGEWLVELAGLSTPTVDGAAQQGTTFLNESAPRQSADFDAVALFLQCARRLKANFMPNAQELAAVVRICRLVDGLPLGIELAASWVRALSCGEIADEIEHNLAFLTTNQRGVPERHRSMQAVFDYSWHLLAEEEQRVLWELALFRGGFTREAAAAVTGATLPVLSTLLAKSLLQRNGQQRYEMHELVRQCSATKFTIAPAQQTARRQQFSHYFLTFLTKQGEALMSRRQKAALAECNLEIDNIRQAWQWAVETQQDELVRTAAWPLFYFFDLRNYFEEGEATFDRAQRLLHPQPAASDPGRADHRVTATLLAAYWSVFALRLGRPTEAMALLGQALEQRSTHNDEMLVLVLLTFYGLGCWYTGKYGEAVACQQEALHLSQRLDRPWFIAWNMLLLGLAQHNLGNYQEAYQLISASVAYSRKLGDPQAISNGLALLSPTAQLLGRQQEMNDLLHEARQLAQETDDRFSFAIATEQLALVALARGEIAEAKRLLEECYTDFQQVSHSSQARLLSHFGKIALLQSNIPEAQRCFLAALQGAMQVEVLPYALDALVGLAALSSQLNNAELALALAEVVRRHPATTSETRIQSEQLAAELTPGLSTEQKAVALARFQGQTLDSVTATVVALTW